MPDLPAVVLEAQRPRPQEEPLEMPSVIAPAPERRVVPARDCPHCGETMNRGFRTPAGLAVYSHLTTCEVLAGQIRRADWEKKQALLTRMAEGQSELPPDVESFGLLPDYLRRHDAGRAGRVAGRILRSYEAGRQRGRLPRRGATFAGEVGAGKTTLVCALARSILALQIPRLTLKFVKAVDLRNRLSRAMDEHNLGERLEEYTTYGVLILDDLGLELKNRWWTLQVIAAIIDFRYTQGLPTFVTTPLTHEQLFREYTLGATDGEGGRSLAVEAMFSRIDSRMAWVTLDGGSRRRPEHD